jgi:hypothetical protein
MLEWMRRALRAERRLRSAERERDAARALAAASMKRLSDDQLQALRRHLADTSGEAFEREGDDLEAI